MGGVDDEGLEFIWQACRGASDETFETHCLSSSQVPLMLRADARLFTGITQQHINNLYRCTLETKLPGISFLACKCARACSGKRTAAQSLSSSHLETHTSIHCFCVPVQTVAALWTARSNVLCRIWGRRDKHTHQQQQLSSITHKVGGNPTVILDKYAALHGMKQQQSD